MGTGGACGPRRALGRGAGPVLLAAALVTGCGEPHTPNGASAARQSTPPGSGAAPSPAATPPEDLCARIVAHWSREVLDDGTYGDYQSMGLSNGQYDILRDVVDAARITKAREGRKAAERLIDRETRTGCEAWYRDGGPGEGPWS
ncbi:hypothetical protein [Streptomyces sp. BV286]|uniref:hypothetical protein n=1 Tax=Streptomyces sp. BV286 TaxID=2849672 RepID=UPI0020C66BB4|nr:hypothetical protein [Streptomyces sp. BV286]